MGRAYYSRPISKFLNDNESFILGELSKFNQFSLEEQQRNALIKQIRILKEQLKNCETGHIIFEYTIPRMGKRVDVIIIKNSVVFVMEFKVNETEYSRRVTFFNGMHRFLPALIQLQKGEVKQIAVRHYPRVAGQSKFNLWNRLLSPFLDCFAYRWMKKRYINYKVGENNL